MLLAGASLLAQTTKVRGTVTDADTGEPIPFAGIFFKGTTIGLTADIDGKYTLETRDPAAQILVCQLLGYDTQEKAVKRGAFTEVNFRLKLTDNQLSGAFVKADNRLIKRLLRNIDAHRDHAVCGILVLDAWRRLGRKFQLYYYEVMTGDQTQMFRPTHWVNIGTVLERKHKACYCHVSQQLEPIFEGWHEPMEKFRGIESHCSAAEAFALHTVSLGGI